jgi:hypothetical protein
MIHALLLAVAATATHVTWHDAARKRDVPVKMYAPACNGYLWEAYLKGHTTATRWFSDGGWEKLVAADGVVERKKSATNKE